MATARQSHTATLLTSGPNAGKVLVAGGLGTGGTVLASAELYDPATGLWSSTGAMNTARQSHMALILTSGPDAGKVLAAGGGGTGGTVLAAAELYDPMTGAWANTNPMNVPRQTFTATVLPIGTVLAAGGLTTGGSLTLTAETYRPLSGTWSITGSLITARQAHTATVLTFGPNGGKVLAAGGQNAFGNGIATAEIYDPASGGWAATGALNQGRAFSTATVLPNGTVLAAGGTTVLVATTNSTEIYNPATGSWAMSGALKNVRAKHTATLLPTSQVLAAGGSFSGVPLASSELFSSSVP